MRMAIRLLQVGLREPEGRKTWKLHRKWRSGLEWAGIDPGTLEITEWHRFNLAWRQLTGNRCTYSEKRQRLLIASGQSAPMATDYVVWVQDNKPRKKKPESENDPEPESEFARSIISYLNRLR
jgi:hypothetical protein